MCVKAIAAALFSALTFTGCGVSNPQSAASSLHSIPFQLGGQSGWFHDEGHSGGYFHTYDAFKVGGATNKPRKIHVFLPRDYETSKRHYPVIYMNDGQTAFFPGGAVGKSWNTANVLSDLYKENAMPPVIIVAIHPLDRDFEYTHEEVLPKIPSGGLSSYAQYIASDVKPWFDSTYRTLATRENTAIIGSSHGGLAAFYTAGTYHRQFGFAGCLSPSFWVGVDTVTYLQGSLGRSSLIEATSPGLASPSHPRIWIDWGLIRSGGFHNAWIEEHAAKRGSEMVSLMKNSFGYEEGKDLFSYEDPRGEHSEESWSRRLPMVLKAFGQALPPQ